MLSNCHSRRLADASNHRQWIRHRRLSFPPATAGLLAVGAVAGGAVAVGALAIGRLAIADALIRRLRADTIEIRALSVTKLQVAGHVWAPSPTPIQQPETPD